MSVIDTIKALAITVRNEKKKEANSAIRIGDLFLAIIDFIKGLASGQIRQEGVDTYNDTTGGKTSLLNTYPNPQLGWTVLVRNDERNAGKASLYQWNGSTWINLETVVYNDDVATLGGSDKTLQQVDVEIIGVINGVTVKSFYISTSGNTVALNAWKYTKYKNNDLTKIRIKGTAYGLSSRTVAFYNSYDIISSATYISGYTYGDASGSGVNFDNEVSIPIGTKCIAVTDRIDGNIHVYDATINKWKYYDGSSFVGNYLLDKSGKYDSIEDKVLLASNTESILNQAGYIRRADGVFVADSLNISSNFLEINDADMFSVSCYTKGSPVTALAFYDVDKNFISSIDGPGVYGDIKDVDKPEGAIFYKTGRLKQGVNGIVYDFKCDLYSSVPLILNDDEIALIEDGKVQRKIKSASSTSIAPKFKLTDRNVNTFIGSMNTVLDAMFAARSNARFVIESNFTEDLMSNGNGSGRKIIEFQKLLASYWGVQFIDISSKLGLVKRGTINTLQTFIKDGTHPADYPTWDVTNGTPNFTAVNMIARFVADELRPNFEDWTGKKILYIGTSIPAGYPYTSNPLAQYPKIIARLLGCECDNKAVPGSVVRLTKVDGTPIPAAHAPFLSLDSSVNYMNSLVNIIDNYDLVVFSHGRNDFQLDGTDYDLNMWDLSLN